MKAESAAPVLSRIEGKKSTEKTLLKDKQLRAACQDFEAIFINQLLTQMRASIPKGGLFPESQAEEIYRGMLDEEYSKVMSRSGSGLGLGEMLYRQLKK